MCGVFGVVTATGETPDEDLLRSTARLLDHRGPDDSGIYSEPGVGLAHTRLSLLDLNPRSAQPFWDDTGRYCLVYNGEIYNFRRLRSDLEASGIGFRTSSDTEVVLNLLVRDGVEAALPRLEGMFAFALWDRQRAELTLARDRLGIKPMFIHWDGTRLLFASEIQALRPWLRLTPDPWTIAAFLFGSDVPTDGRTFFSGVEFLTPGSVLTVRPGERPVIRRLLTTDGLWDSDHHRELGARRQRDVLAEIERRLVHSVEQQLFADATVGALCSGGLDSSLVMAIAARRHDDLAIFHADVVGPHSESSAAAALASHLGLELEKVEVTDDDFVTLIPQLVLHSGNPFLNTPHSVAMYKVSRLIRESGVKAVLSGEGADEGFLGYPALIADRRRSRPPAMAASLGSQLIGDGRHRHPTDLVTAMLSGFRIDRESARNEETVAALDGGQRPDLIAMSLHLYNHNLRGLLLRNDAMGMAASVECRFPFLDTDFVRLAVNLPAQYKVRRGVTRDHRHRFRVDKWALRVIARKYLPPVISTRPKVGFTSNAYDRLRVDPALFGDSFVSELFHLGKEDIDDLLQRADRKLTARLVHLEAWGQTFIIGENADEVSERLDGSITVRPDRSSPRGRPFLAERVARRLSSRNPPATPLR